jgi:hypothetical protein
MVQVQSTPRPVVLQRIAPDPDLPERLSSRIDLLWSSGVQSDPVVRGPVVPAIVSVGISVVIAVLAGLDTQFRPGEQWRHHRSTQLALSLKRIYEKEAHAGKQGEAFEEFFNKVESLLEAEANQYWTFRITQWPSRET